MMNDSNKEAKMITVHGAVSGVRCITVNGDRSSYKAKSDKGVWIVYKNGAEIARTMKVREIEFIIRTVA